MGAIQVSREDAKPILPRMRLDLTGQKYGELTVLGFSRVDDSQIGYPRYWVCECSCGAVIEVQHGNLRSGRSTRCVPCGNRVGSAKVRKHGMSGTRTHQRWSHLARFGNRVCEKWKTFEGFYEDMGKAPDDRPYLITPADGEINAETCYWSDKMIVPSQMLYSDEDGNPKSLQMFADELGITRERVRQKFAKADELGIDRFDYLYGRVRLDGHKTYREKTDEKYERFLVAGFTHHELDSEDEAIKVSGRLRSHVRSRGLGEIRISRIENHLFVKFSPEGGE